MTGRRWLSGSTGLVLLVVAVGCAALTPRAAAPYAVGPGGKTLSAPSSDVEQAYLAYWDDWLAANKSGDTSAEQLARHAEEPNLSILRAALIESAKEGYGHTGTVKHRIEGMAADGELRRIYDCVDLNQWLITDATTGQPISQLTSRPPELAIMTLRQFGDVWKVTDIQKPLACSASTAGK